jgi:hypothetical protein
MNLRARQLAVGILAGLMVAVQTPSAELIQQAPYTLVQLGSGFSPAMDINDTGTVVGWWFGPNGSKGYTWTLDSGIRPMIADPAAAARFPVYTAVNMPTDALRISAAGLIVGTDCGNPCSLRQAALWDPTSGLQTIGAFAAGSDTSGVGGVNATGTVVGYSYGGGYNNFGPFTWSNGTIAKLSGFIGINGHALGVNVHGTVVGSRGTGTRTMAFAWSPQSGHTDIPDVAGATASTAFAINDSGVAVGRATLAGGSTVVFRWSSATGTEELQAPAGYVELLDINNAGDIVATIITNGIRVPYIYQGGTWTDINQLLPSGTLFRLQFVEAINNRGWIVGSGTTAPPTELGQGFVLIPPNQTPTAAESQMSATEDADTNAVLSASDPDGDDLTFSIVTNGAKGTATLTDAATGAVVYTPNPNANGSDSFTFRVSDGNADSNVATVTVTIAPVNDMPVASEGTGTVSAGQSSIGSLAAADVDGDTLTYSVVQNGAKGTATVTDATAGTYTYSAAPGSSGTDTFTFKANDGSADSNIATVTVTIIPDASCAADVTASIGVSAGAPRLDRKSGALTQKITLRNIGASTLTGPVSLVFDALSTGASVIGPAGSTSCAAPLGSQYVTVNVGADGVLADRERASVEVRFTQSGTTPISYTARVLAGAGGR